MLGHETGVFQWEAVTQAMSGSPKDSSLGHRAGDAGRREDPVLGTSGGQQNSCLSSSFDSSHGPDLGDSVYVHSGT